MLKKHLVRAAVVLATTVLPLASSYSVQAAGPTGTYSTGITCVNLGGAAAAVSLAFYSADNGTASTTYAVPSTVAPKSNVILFTPNIPGLGSLLGSAVVSSDQQLACTAESQRSDGTPGTSTTPARAATSESFDPSQAASTLYAPQVVKALGNASSGVYNSYVAVQNTESAAVTVTLSFVDRFGVSYPAANESVSIPGQASHYFYQDQNANLPTGFSGSAKITASDGTKRLAATVVMYNDGSAVEKSQMLAYNASGAGGQKLTVAQWTRNYYGYNSGAQIMNIGATTTTVTSTYTFPGSNVYTRVDQIGPLKVVSLYTPNVSQLAPVDGLAVNLRSGSAIFQADPGGTIIANVNLRNDGSCGAASCPAIPANQIGVGSAVNAFVDGTATTKAIVSRFPKSLGGETINGGFAVVNATAVAGTCDFEFVGTFTQSSVALAASGAVNRFAGSENVVTVTVGSQSPVYISCTQPVFVSANTRSDLTTYRGDSVTSWNVINLP